MPDVSFADFVTGLSADTIGGAELIPLVDTTAKKTTPADLAAYVIDQLVAAAAVTSLTDAHEMTVYTSAGDEKIITMANVSAWIMDEIEAITTGTTIVSGDTIIYSDGGVLKQIDIDNIVTFINSTNGTLGAQVDALSAATLADTDEYLVEQGGTALKTTFSAIAARVHSQFLTYLGTLTAATSIVDADTLYVNDGGTAKSVAASVLADYILAENKAEVIASAWDDLSALGAAVAGTDVFLLERSGVGKTATGANLFSYIVSALDAAGAATPTVATGDDFLMLRSGTQYETDVDELATYVHDAIWSSTSGNPVVDADEVAIGRSGDTLTVTAAQLQTYVLTGIQSTVFDLTGLTAATLDDTDLFLVGESTTGKKATAAEVATYVKTAIQTDVLEYAWDNYAAVSPGLTGDVLLAERAGVGKTITIDSIAAFAVASQTAASAASPVAAGDDFLMFRSGTQYQADVDVLATYILKQAWSASSGDPVASGDELAIGRSGTTYSVTVDQLQTFVLDGNQQDVLNFSGLNAATLGSTYLFGVYTGSTAEKVTLANLETKLWTDLDTRIGALTAATSIVDANIFYCLQSGTPKSVTGDILAAYIDDELWADASAASPAAAGDVFFMRRSGTSYTVDIDVLATYINTSVQDSVLDFSGLASAVPNSADEFVVDDAGTPKSLTLSALETKLWADYATYVAALTAVTTTADTDKFYCIQGGTPKYVTPVELATYFDVGTGDVLGPVTTTENKIPQWDSTTKTLKDGLTLVTTITPDGMSDTQVPTAQAVDEYFSEAVLDIDGLTDIGAALVDADLIVVDDGAAGNNRKSAVSRLWTYITGKIQGLTDKATPVAADILMIQDSAASNALKELTVGNLWANRYASETLATAAGTGITAAAASYVAGVERVGSFFRTTIVLDLTGLRSTAAGDIIGDDGTANPCYIGQITAAKNGTIFAGKIECLETPAGGDPDIDLYSATEATGVEDAAITTLTETQLINAGDHAANAFKSLTAFPAADEYLYLVAGDTTDADYTAGILKIELWGK